MRRPVKLGRGDKVTRGQGDKGTRERRIIQLNVPRSPFSLSELRIPNSEFIHRIELLRIETALFHRVASFASHRHCPQLQKR